jgi:hypothetical protein
MRCQLPNRLICTREAPRHTPDSLCAAG